MSFSIINALRNEMLKGYFPERQSLAPISSQLLATSHATQRPHPLVDVRMSHPHTLDNDGTSHTANISYATYCAFRHNTKRA
jgi:hypothetical protein